MDQDQTVDNELQKAIDEITNTTSVDPTFSDPVAAPSTLPEDGEAEPIEPVGPFPAPEPVFDFSNIEMPELPEEPKEEAPAPAPVEAPKETAATANLGFKEIKDSALRDLLPLLDKTNLSASEKFGICRDAFEDLKDYTALNTAYGAAKKISDEKERAEALLYLVKSIDKID